MSLYYPLTPVQKLCDACGGLGWTPEDHELCKACGSIGRVFIDGGPSFGCKITLVQCKPGQIVILGNGDRGRVIRHVRRGEPTTELALIDPMFETEDRATTTYPSVTGVASQSAVWWQDDPSGQKQGRRDQLDPLQDRTTP